MKNLFIIQLIFLFAVTGFSQNQIVTYPYQFSTSIKKEKLSDARSLSDVMPQYNPESMMKHIAWEISATCNGEKTTIPGTGDMLNDGQKKILNSADPGTEIFVNFTYKYTKIQYYTFVVPDMEAEYPGGTNALWNKLSESIFAKFPDKKLFPVLTFIIDEEGQTSDIKLIESSSDPAVDKLLVDALSNMPKWKPAQNSKGIKVKQEFKLRWSGGC